MSDRPERIVGEEEADLRLDRWFALHCPDLPHGALARLLRKGRIRVDGRRSALSLRVQAGMCISFPPGLTGWAPADSGPGTGGPESADDSRLARQIDRLAGRVLYRDEQYLVINKPQGLAVQGGTGLDCHLDRLLPGLALRLGIGRLRLVHRLDRETSGALVLACSLASARLFTEHLRQRRITKTYWALVERAPEPAAGVWRDRLARTPGSVRPGARMQATPDGLEAITAYRILGRPPGRGRTQGRGPAWLELCPRTGRTHQLRIQTALHGGAILGDRLYGQAQDPAGRLHLHARCIDLPEIDQPVTAPLPDALARSWRDHGFGEPPDPPQPQDQGRQAQQTKQDRQGQ